MKAKRVIHIDAKARTIKETLVATLEDMQKLVGGLICYATTLDNGDEVYCNDEGLFGADEEGLLDFVRFNHDDAIFAGSVYVIGHATRAGNSTDAKSSVKEITQLVQFRRGRVML
jgi:hypothetical protein